jgi:NADPH-dependent curcumin reductase CurA
MFYIQPINYIIVTEILCEAEWFSVDPYMRQVTMEFILINIYI